MERQAPRECAQDSMRCCAWSMLLRMLLIISCRRCLMDRMDPGVSWGWALQVILMAGLQGVGKTTACGKLALALQKRSKRVLMVATDVYRPAAIDQLVKLGERIKVARKSADRSLWFSAPKILKRGCPSWP